LVTLFAPPTRAQLARVANGDRELLYALEALWRQSGETLPNDVASLSLQVEANTNAAEEALAAARIQQDVFASFAVAGEPTVTATDAADVVTFVEGPNITLTTDAAAKTITIEASGGGGGGFGSGVLSFGGLPGGGVATLVVTGQSGILANSRIRAWVQGSTADFNEYEHQLILPGRIGLGIGDVVAATGFTVYAETELRLAGAVAVKWEWV
jgi:hypothetical protein